MSRLRPTPMPSTETAERHRSRYALALYYGKDALPLLTRYQRIVVQPGHFSAAQVGWLRQRGVQVLAYLSLGEDGSGQQQDWLTDEPPTIWNTRLVNASHPQWRAQIQAQVLRDRAVFSGFFLDTIDSASRDSRHLRAMLKLVRLVRQWAGPKYLLINRGVGLLHRLRGAVNGVLIEAFSTTWQPATAPPTRSTLDHSVLPASALDALTGAFSNLGPEKYRAYTKPELDYTAQLVEQVRRLGLDVFALDYADTPRLRRFALRRAASFGIPTFVSNRELSLPNGYTPPRRASTNGHGSAGAGSNGQRSML